MAWTFPHYRLLQFAKAPQPGRVKTRMQPYLTAAAATQLHCELTNRVYTQLLAAELCPLELWTSSADPFFTELAQGQTPIFEQVAGDLGERMSAAVTTALSREAVQGVILVGSDCPFLDAGYLRQALEGLESGQDAVLGPATDGGYVLLALAHSNKHVFKDIDWGSERVAAQTTARLDELGWRYSRLAPLADIDRPEDLQLLPVDWPNSSWAS